MLKIYNDEHAETVSKLDNKLELIDNSFHKIVNEDMRNKADASDTDTLQSRVMKLEAELKEMKDG